MPAEAKGKSITRMAPYRMNQRPPPLLPSVTTTSTGVPLANHFGPLPLAGHWQHGPQVLDNSNDFIRLLSAYLKAKNEAYRQEILQLEEALTEAEDTSKALKEKAAKLGGALDALEGAVTAASSILSNSLMCIICYETCSNPTSLKCGHSFCRDCLQSWFLKKFEGKCEEYGIDLTAAQYDYIYRQPSTTVEAENNMVSFSTLSNQLNPNYICPSCRDPLLPQVRNSFLDFKLAASLTTLNTLVGFKPESPPAWKLAAIDLLGFLNSSFYHRRTGQLPFDIDLDDIVDMDV